MMIEKRRLKKTLIGFFRCDRIVNLKEEMMEGEGEDVLTVEG